MDLFILMLWIQVRLPSQQKEKKRKHIYTQDKGASDGRTYDTFVFEFRFFQQQEEDVGSFFFEGGREAPALGIERQEKDKKDTKKSDQRKI